MKPGSDKLGQTQPQCALWLRGSTFSMFVDMFVQCQNLPTLDFFLRMMRVLKISLAEVCKFIASTRRRIKERRKVTPGGKVLNSNVQFLRHGRKLAPEKRSTKRKLNFLSKHFTFITSFPSIHSQLLSILKKMAEIHKFAMNSAFIYKGQRIHESSSEHTTSQCMEILSVV